MEHGIHNLHNITFCSIEIIFTFFILFLTECIGIELELEYRASYFSGKIAEQFQTCD